MKKHVSMKESLKHIDQAGIKALLEARYHNPELYADQPLFIWRAAWNDAIQQRSALEVMREDRKLPIEERRCFRLRTIRAGKDYTGMFTEQPEGKTIGFLAYPGEALSLNDCLKEVERMREANGSGKPLIIYLPYPPQPIDIPGEQYVFDPDFEQWASKCHNTLIRDFIRGDGQKEGILYRWYNLFNDPDKGVTTPLLWLSVSNSLNKAVRIERDLMPENSDKRKYTIKDLKEHIIRSAFQNAMENPKGHVSPDVVDDFIIYLKYLP